MASTLVGQSYTIAFKLYSDDGRREVEVREFSNGETYLVERDLLEGQISVTGTPAEWWGLLPLQNMPRYLSLPRLGSKVVLTNLQRTGPFERSNKNKFTSCQTDSLSICPKSA
jgi:hypothetical protein